MWRGTLNRGINKGIGSLAWGYGRCNNRMPMEPDQDPKPRLHIELLFRSKHPERLSRFAVPSEKRHLRVFTDLASERHRSISLANRTHSPTSLMKTLTSTHPTRVARPTSIASLVFLAVTIFSAFALAQDAP